MRTRTIIAALILSATTHAPARHPYDPPATSADVFMAQQQAAADAAHIQAQNARLIELQEKAARDAEWARIEASLAASSRQPDPAPAPVSQDWSFPVPRPVAQPTPPARRIPTANEILGAAAYIHLTRGDPKLTDAEKEAKIHTMIVKLIYAP